MKHFTKQSRSLCSLHGKKVIQMNSTVYTSKEKNYEFSSKKHSATKHSPPSNVYYIEFYTYFVIAQNLDHGPPLFILFSKNIRQL